jgi:hypothetical protein
MCLLDTSGGPRQGTCARASRGTQPGRAGGVPVVLGGGRTGGGPGRLALPLQWACTQWPSTLIARRAAITCPCPLSTCGAGPGGVVHRHALQCRARRAVGRRVPPGRAPAGAPPSRRRGDAACPPGPGLPGLHARPSRESESNLSRSRSRVRVPECVPRCSECPHCPCLRVPASIEISIKLAA